MNHHVPLLPAASSLLPPTPAPDHPLAGLDTDMRFVLEAHARLGRRPLEYSLPRLARRQPDLEAAAEKILAAQGRKPEQRNVVCEDITVETGDAALPARIFRPEAEADLPRPIILFLHDGLFVTGDVARTDSVPRMLASRCNALVVSLGYRQAPEHRFPAAHDDALEGWNWLMRESHALGGDPGLSAVAGEGSGANLAVHIALNARSPRRRPRHLLMITPMVSGEQASAGSSPRNGASPLGAAGVRWALRHALGPDADRNDPRIDLLARSDLGRLPPTTLVLAEADPLCVGGEALGRAINRAGTDCDVTVYDGVAHGFFALGALVNKAMFAQAHASSRLDQTFRLARANGH